MSAAVPNNVIVTDERNIVTVEQDAPNTVIIRSTSAQTINTRRHVHTQGVASTEWVITHTLGGYPSVTIVDSAKTHVFGEVQYDSTTQITVSFSAAFSGYAYLT